MICCILNLVYGEWMGNMRVQFLEDDKGECI